MVSSYMVNHDSIEVSNKIFGRKTETQKELKALIRKDVFDLAVKHNINLIFTVVVVSNMIIERFKLLLKRIKIMYLWIGLGIDKENEDYIREYCKKNNMKYKVNEQSFTLPQHISLKTSFDTEEYQNIINDFKNMFRNNKKMNLKVYDIEMVPGVIWLNINEIPELREYHNLILDHLKEKYNIEKIGFDGENFKFHSTLFQDVDNKEKVSELYENIDKEILINKESNINRIYFGVSEVGKVGTYKVVDYI